MISFLWRLGCLYWFIFRINQFIRIIHLPFQEILSTLMKTFLMPIPRTNRWLLIVLHWIFALRWIHRWGVSKDNVCMLICYSLGVKIKLAYFSLVWTVIIYWISLGKLALSWYLNSVSSVIRDCSLVNFETLSIRVGIENVFF